MWSAFSWFLLFSSFGSVKTDRNRQEAIKAFAELHSIHCHTLIFTFSNEFYERRALLDFHIALNSNYYIPAALENIINIDSMINANFDRRQCSRSLRSFIMGNVSHIVEYMKTDNLFIKKLNKAVMEQNISNLPTTYLQGLQRVCYKKNYAFMASRMTVFKLQSRILCKIHYLTNEAIRGSIAYTVSKHNNYLPFINRWLYVLNQVGLMAKLKGDIVGSERPSLDDPLTLRSVGWEDTILLQSLLIPGVVLSILILCAEIVHNRMRKNKKANNR